MPTLYDKKLKCIVNNESSEIIRMFYTEVSLDQLEKSIGNCVGEED